MVIYHQSLTTTDWTILTEVLCLSTAWVQASWLTRVMYLYMCIINGTVVTLKVSHAIARRSSISKHYVYQSFQRRYCCAIRWIANSFSKIFIIPKFLLKTGSMLNLIPLTQSESKTQITIYKATLIFKFI